MARPLARRSVQSELDPSWEILVSTGCVEEFDLHLVFRKGYASGLALRSRRALFIDGEFRRASEVEALVQRLMSRIHDQRKTST